MGKVIAINLGRRPISDIYQCDSGRTVHVHSILDCNGEPCPIHSPSKNHMSEWPDHWVTEITEESNGWMARTCPHGQHHPHPDGYKAQWRGHECDGCCSSLFSL